jgi:hypothetical protein
MFLQNLTAEQKKSFFILAKKLVIADSKIMPEEEDMLSLMKREMNLEFDVENINTYATKELCKEFSDRNLKISVLVELINLGYVDKEYCDEEKIFIKDVAKEFGIPDDKLVLCENWVNKKIALFKEVEKI